jgi:hypothetical protein
MTMTVSLDCGQPDIEICRVGERQLQVEIRGVDTYDPPPAKSARNPPTTSLVGPSTRPTATAGSLSAATTPWAPTTHATSSANRTADGRSMLLDASPTSGADGFR